MGHNIIFALFDFHTHRMALNNWTMKSSFPTPLQDHSPYHLTDSVWVQGIVLMIDLNESQHSWLSW